MPIQYIDAHEFKRRSESGPVLAIDVRQPNEFRALHVAGAHLCPLPALTPEHVIASRRALGVVEDEPIYVLCQTGRRARTAAERLARETALALIVVEGGTVACRAAGVATTSGEEHVSIERQVRIAAGGLVVAGTVLGTFVTPFAYAGAAIVGAGLVFAGATDTCLLGTVLSKMPWNTRSTGCAP